MFVFVVCLLSLSSGWSEAPKEHLSNLIRSDDQSVVWRDRDR